MKTIWNCLHDFRMPLRGALCSAMLLLPGTICATPIEEIADERSVVATGNQAVPGHAIETKDSINIYFKGGKSVYEPNLNNNRDVLADYIEYIKALNSEGRLNEIIIKGYVSPEGSSSVNEKLAKQRSEVLANIIQREAGVDRSIIQTMPAGINWSELRRLIATSPGVPSREAFLNIIDNTPFWIFDKQGKIIGGRLKSMMDLRGGKPYQWLYANLFPELRKAVGVTLSYSAPLSPIVQERTIPQDSIKEPLSEPVTLPDDILIIEEEQCVNDIQVIENSMPEYEKIDDWALKTNLIYDALLIPNLELEWRFAKHWSALISGNVAWYARESEYKAYRIGFGTLEARYWFRADQRWSGWYVGAMAGGGLYDLDFGIKHLGHLGEGGFAGVSGGYMWPIGQHLLIETGLGLGWMYTRYKEYTHLDGHNPYVRTKVMNYFGPISLKVSIGWRFDRKVKKRVVDNKE